MTQELRWKSNNQRVAARAFTLLRITDLPDGGQKIEVMPDLKTGSFVEVYLAVIAPPPPPINLPPVSGVATLHAEVP